MTKASHNQANNETPCSDPKVQNRTQQVCKRALRDLGTPKAWADALQLKGDFADRTIRAWANGEKVIPEFRLIWILDAADLFFRDNASLQIAIFDERQLILKKRTK